MNPYISIECDHDKFEDDICTQCGYEREDLATRKKQFIADMMETEDNYGQD